MTAARLPRSKTVGREHRATRHIAALRDLEYKMREDVARRALQIAGGRSEFPFFAALQPPTALPP